MNDSLKIADGRYLTNFEKGLIQRTWDKGSSKKKKQLEKMYKGLWIPTV